MNLTRMFAALALTAAISGMAAPQAAKAQADQRNFKVVNYTGRQIDHLYVSPQESILWGRDVLGEGSYDVLPNGTETTITFPPAWQTSCVMNFKVKFHDGSETYPEGRNVCQLYGVVFYPGWSEGF